jgi:hypothetical protein
VNPKELKQIGNMMYNIIWEVLGRAFIGNMLQKDHYVPHYWGTRKCMIAKASRRPMEHDMMILRLLGT